jgi:enoyl-[acyl-carrier protein] reductase I
MSKQNDNQFLKGQKALIVGLANERSLAWGIARKLEAAGADLGFTYLDASFEKRVRGLAEGIGASLIGPCDVADDAQIDALFARVREQWGRLDILIHAVAFAKRDDLNSRFIDCSREGFGVALDISAYSLVALSRRAEALMPDGGTILTLTYYGSQKVVPNYHITGVAKAALEASTRYLAHDLGRRRIRVNAISAGPVKTLSASGIKDFRALLNTAAERTPLGENISAADVGEMAAFLCGPGGRHITGSVLFVDSGANIMGI